MNFKEQAVKLKQNLPAVFLALKDRDTPMIARVMAAVTIAYALSPIDLIPDFIPVLGYLDDVILLPFMIMLTVKLIPQDVWNRSMEQSRQLWKNGRPKKWYYSIPVIMIWVAVLYSVIRKLHLI